MYHIAPLCCLPFHFLWLTDTDFLIVADMLMSLCSVEHNLRLLLAVNVLHVQFT